MLVRSTRLHIHALAVQPVLQVTLEKLRGVVHPENSEGLSPAPAILHVFPDVSGSF